MKNNSRLGLWVIIPGWILAFAARMAQICVGTDMTSGFLKYDNGFFMNACFWGRGYPHPRRSRGRSILRPQERLRVLPDPGGARHR